MREGWWFFFLTTAIQLIELLGLTESDFKLVDELRIERLCEVLQRDWSRSRSNRRLLSALVSFSGSCIYAVTLAVLLDA